MPSLAAITASAVALILLIFVVWRLASHRHTIPCPSWLGWMVELENPFAHSNHASFIVQQLGLVRGMRVLDAGCGPGRVTIPLAEAVGPEGAVVAVDLQDRMLRSVMSKGRSTGLTNLSTRQLGLGQGKLEEGFFDRAVVAAVLGEIPNRQAAINELFCCLKPSGLLAVAELIFDPHFQTQSSVRRLASSAGFQEYSCFGHKFAYLLVFQRPE